MRIEVHAKPKSKREYVKKVSENTYVVAVNAPPEDGKANERITELLSDFLKVPKSKLMLLRGHASKVKVFEIISS